MRVFGLRGVWSPRAGHVRRPARSCAGRTSHILVFGLTAASSLTARMADCRAEVTMRLLKLLLLLVALVCAAGPAVAEPYEDAVSVNAG